MALPNANMSKDAVRAELDRVRQLYHENAKINNSYNLLVYGEKGTGKTRLAKTCRRPILLHSFDPGGTKTIRKEIDEGWIIADTQYEHEDARKPSAYRKWEKQFDSLRRSNFFDNVGTFYLDSITTWADALLNEVLKQKGRIGMTPQLQEYMIQQTTMKDILKIITMLPCDCVLTGHIGVDKDEVTGAIHSSLLLGPKAAIKMPILFDEMYVSVAKSRGSKIEYQLVTANTGYYKATTRIGGEGKFDTYETPDIKHLLEKSGMNNSDITM